MLSKLVDAEKLNYIFKTICRFVKRALAQPQHENCIDFTCLGKFYQKPYFSQRLACDSFIFKSLNSKRQDSVCTEKEEGANCSLLYTLNLLNTSFWMLLVKSKISISR